MKDAELKNPPARIQSDIVWIWNCIDQKMDRAGSRVENRIGRTYKPQEKLRKPKFKWIETAQNSIDYFVLNSDENVEESTIC